MAITKIGTPELFDFSATNTALQLPTGDTASRPSAPSTGEWRYNSELKYVEYYDGAAWFQIDTESSAVPIVANENFNTNTYSGTGATHTIDAKFNEAANFDGASSYIQIANNSFTYTTMTFSAWVNPSANDTNNYIFQIGMYDNRIGGSIGWYVRRESGGSLLARGFSSNSLTVAEFDVTSASSLIPLNTWTNVVCVLTPTSFNIYINGNSTAVASATFSNAITYSASQPSAVVIGATYYYFNAVIYESWWEGAIDQVRIFNTALTSAQVEDLYTDETTTTAATLDFPAGAGCVAAYQLDGNANDISTNYNGTATNIGYTGLKFQPDMIWTKSRSNALNHTLFDSVRGTTESLRPNGTTIEQTRSGVTSFDSNGFTIGTDDESGGQSGYTYVSWCFKGGGTAVENNDGTINGANCLVSANQASGFSIVKYVGNNTQNATVGHGLGIEPKMVIIKRLDVANAWWIPLPILGSNEFMEFSTASATTDVQYQYTQTSDIFKFTSATQSAQYNASGGRYVMYSFADIAGYQKVGSYTGSGTSSNVVYTTSDGTSTGTGGFQPRFLLIKSTSSNGNFWNMFDSARTSGANGKGRLYPNSASAEDGTLDISFNANNFTLLTSNSDINGGNDYIYLAIA